MSRLEIARASKLPVVVDGVLIGLDVWAAVIDVAIELAKAKAAWPNPFNNAHEGYGVITEEWRELEEHVFTNQKRRDLEAMRKEAIQLAAMATRFSVEVCDEGRGRK